MNDALEDYTVNIYRQSIKQLQEQQPGLVAPRIRQIFCLYQDEHFS